MSSLPVLRRSPGSLVILSLLVALALVLTGCLPSSDPESKALVSKGLPQRVVTQIINNTCGDEESEEESVSTGKVKGLSKVIDGFGIPYDERADNYTTNPSIVTDDSYEANKERGIGYTGIEDHYVASLAAGQQHSPDHPEHEDVGVAMFDGLSTEEEQYGCAMRWEYYNPDLSGPAVDGYFNFLKGNGSGHMQYLAVHATVSDKWVIVCPYDWGPALNLPTTGGGKYAHGRIGGLSPAAAEALGISDGGGPENAMTEWWWVENSSQVKCGPVDDLSQFAKGSTSSSSSSSAGTKASVAVNVSVAASSVLDDIARNSASGDGTTVTIAPANENSFVNETNPSIVTGTVDKGSIQKIVLHDIIDYIEATPSCFNAHFSISEDGTITKKASIGQITNHTGDPTTDGVSIGIALQKSTAGCAYSKAQLNSLDRLIAYVDKNLGRQVELTCHNETQSDALPIKEYQETRNHSGVTTVADAKEAAEAGDCDDSGESEENPDAGGPGIAKKAVEISGTATPDTYIAGDWGVEPTDSRLSAYVSEKNRVYPGVPGWADCGRCSSTAVKASGADETFPEGDTAAQFAYMSSSQKWQRAGTLRTGDNPDSLCEPGDVLVTEGKGHIMVYVGNEAVKKKYPDSNANFFEGSLGMYYGWCYSRESHMGRDYAIFRCVNPDNAEAKSTGSADELIYIQQVSEGAHGNISEGKEIECGWCAGSHGLIMVLGDYSLTPESIAQRCREKFGNTFASGTYNWEIVNKMCKAYGVPSHFVQNMSISQMRECLQAGCPVMMTGQECEFYKADGSRRIHHSHSICFYKYENGKYWAKDSAPSDGAAMCPYPEEAVARDFLPGRSVLVMGDDGHGNISTELAANSGKKTTKSKKSSGKTKSAPGTGSVLGRQIAWLAVQMCPVASDQSSPLYEPNIYPWNKIPDSRLDNEFAIMDAEEALCPEFNCAYASCCQAACGVYAAVADMDSLPHSNASGGPGRTAKWMRDHPEIYQKVDVQSMDDLKPGDILTNANPDFESLGRLEGNGHVAIYVGNEMAKTKFPGTTGDVYQAGFSEGVHAKYPSLDSLGGIEGFRAMEYTAYRVIARNKNSQYPDIDWKKLIKDPSCKCPTSGDDDSDMGDGRQIYVDVSKAG